ncbi:hypothetical protein J2X69_003349 [Algoriphagus sp. 4150]|nr:hypothetical protein [Algoriphagus sp. 4150]MDR7130990.1 hypothetical protein [Algoriphagus sp. 4150]
MTNKQTLEECQKALLSIRKISYQKKSNSKNGKVTGSFFRECRTTITRA